MYWNDEVQLQAKCKRALRRDMVKNGLDLGDDLILDGEEHAYEAYQNGMHKRAEYTALLYPLDSDGPTLAACYGADGEWHNYSWSPPEDKK